MPVSKRAKHMTLLFITLFVCLVTVPFSGKAQGAVAKFADAKGKIYLEMNVKEGDVFPALAFKNDRTFQGWSKKKGRTKGAKWMEGQMLPMTNATYYPVIAGTKTESKPGKLVEPKNHSYVYLVGDSRMVYTFRQYRSKLKKTRVVAKCRKGYSWLVNQGGYDALIKAIQKDGKRKKKKAVVFCLGVNDLQNVEQYITFYEAKAEELKKLHCDLFVMSINPFSAKQRELYKHTVTGTTRYVDRKTFAQANIFNKKLKKLKDYTYIDVSGYLRSVGFAYVKKITPDGLHYSKKTNKKVLHCIFQAVG